MKIVAEYNEIHTDAIEIKSASFIGDYAIRLHFNDVMSSNKP